MRPSRSRLVALGAALGLAAATTLAAQDTASHAAGRHPTHAPISIGDYPRVDGLRLNFRDRALERVRGINATIWGPYDRSDGVVTGLSLGLPLTGVGEVNGVALGALGASATGRLNGIAIGGLGVGAGGGTRGIAIGGLGVGSGGDMQGITIGGLGVGGGGRLDGITIGGLGAGGGGSVRGLIVGGLGAGVGGSIRGVAIGGLAAGAGGDVRGVVLAGIGSGAGGNVTGLTIIGVGSGAGGTMHGIGIAGVGIGAPTLEGLFVASAVGAQNARAIVLAPVLFRLEPGGTFRGASVSAVNYVRGTERGLSLGIVNYARVLRGAQIGLINIIADQPSHPVLPIVNWGSAR